MSSTQTIRVHNNNKMHYHLWSSNIKSQIINLKEIFSSQLKLKYKENIRLNKWLKTIDNLITLKINNLKKIFRAN
jgi:hypothetical protein